MISGFANTSGGTLIVGVKEPNTITGTDIARFEKFLQKTKELLNGKVEISSYSVELEGKLLGVIEVQKSKIPIASLEGYFRRVGATEVPLDASQIVELMSSVPDHVAAIASLSKTIAKQSAEFGKLRESFEKVNSWTRKAFYALLGAVATAVVKLVLAAVGLAGG